ncbi:MAG: hypothetical protein IPF66_13800 [Holophagales bacterium]|nr:hypothetical protein [Holophagales bacterium]
MIAPFALPWITVSEISSRPSALTWIPVPSPPAVPVTVLPVIRGAAPASTWIPR